jgi:hypothetical protein
MMWHGPPACPNSVKISASGPGPRNARYASLRGEREGRARQATISLAGL